MTARRAGFSLGCNVVYVVYLGAQGMVRSSIWLFWLSGFYALLTAMRLGVMLFFRGKRALRSAAAQQAAGVLLLALSGIWICVLIAGQWQYASAGCDKITMIAIASYTFGKAGAAIVCAVRRRSTSAALERALPLLRLGETAASAFTLQQSMLSSFGTLERTRQCCMNAWTGTGVGLFLLALGSAAIIISRKEMNHGKIKSCKSKRKNCTESDCCF